MKNSKIFALILAGSLITTACACQKNDLGDAVDTSEDTSAVISGETFNYSAGLDENGFFEGIKASDIVKLPTYKGVEMPESVTVASAEDLQEEIDLILESYAEEIYDEIMDEAIKDGDTVNIDYVGSVDGVEFDGGSTGGQGTFVTIGVTQYIDDFLEQLIGHKPGENFDIEVTFPEDYGVDELNGKDAIFNITVNYIRGELLETIIPELTDAIAADYGFMSADLLKTDIENWLINNQKYTFVNDILASAVCEEIPQSVIDYFKNSDVEQFNYYASMYGMSVEEYIQMCGYASLDAYVAEMEESYTENALTYLAAQAIAEIENLYPTDEDITARGYDAYIESYGAPYIKQYILVDELVPDYIIAKAKTTK